ncbi:MAG: hypothetical protein KKH06_00145, partial [Gammaproteobacteria bacterium]|nr:hypothetical protein [Gammaproteobacteria bacterium]
QVEVEYFKKYKKLMDLEFPNSSVIKVASDLGKSWIMCPDCDEAWENKSSAALVECPKCKTLLNNPYQPTE